MWRRAGNMPVVIYFHGNAEIAAWRAERHRALIANGTGLIALSSIAVTQGRPERRPRTACIATPMRPMRLLSPATRPSASCYGATRSAPGSQSGSRAEKPVGKVIPEAPYTSDGRSSVAA